MNGNGAQRAKKAAFLVAYRRSGIVTSATRAAGINRTTYWRWTEHDLTFSAACKQAETEAVEIVEAELRRRALLKTPKTRDTTALIFYLKAHRPEKYRERIEHSGPGGGPIPIDLSRLSTEELNDLERLVRRASANT